MDQIFLCIVPSESIRSFSRWHNLHSMTTHIGCVWVRTAFPTVVLWPNWHHNNVSVWWKKCDTSYWIGQLDFLLHPDTLMSFRMLFWQTAQSFYILVKIHWIWDSLSRWLKSRKISSILGWFNNYAMMIRCVSIFVFIVPNIISNNRIVLHMDGRVTKITVIPYIVHYIEIPADSIMKLNFIRLILPFLLF